MTKSTITRERAQQIFLGNGPEPSASEERELARMTLVAMDSEPVAYIDKQWTLVYYVPPMSMGLKIGDKLYRHAQPAQVAYSDFEEFWSAYIHPLAQDDELKDFAWDIWNACRAAMLAAAPHDTSALNSVQSVVTVPGKWIPVSEQKPDCWCLTCRPVTLNDMRFVVCPDCGNKRCPRANDHRNACARSNEPGQEGSAYPAAPQEVRGE
ncbi:hypothetical protein R8541_14950 [Klebsiella pneumoniae]|uniref:hypothetical protein n=1 Tax=Klebsiella pneumoniae TaxID=573 RepID=UPI0020CCDB03|nr:hypothetical protein [Klebsiella pneumoniae]MCP6387165.1 hypothetical protein [Klebsiella pneumoniae]MCQ0663810.1 hypothetical protein [Klebsiella pneumoniae]WPI13522.1 hypothetical protein R8541_14950 [Klebsiella pneumoniae]